ncbi:DM13 domain-containing protein [Pelagibius sp. Alg239-R121]|uniref:DM13 domain-containing protein n=1 Tax=Pelagibius sp. Alg239-R121 TaxID=2993448 RepID=UPI0024A6EDC0|nr:DM13 domain-containing protein [Pelagibius sp. Alg239-R121]
MFKKYAAVAFVAGTIGFVAGNAFWYLASPLWIDEVVSEDFAGAGSSQILGSGNFKDADGAHRGTGEATLYQTSDGSRTLRFTGFEVTNGPDLKVWLVAKADVASAGDVTGSQTLSLGPLRGNIGDQNYSIPADADLSRYQSVVIWCEQFGVLFSAAALGK